MTGLTKNGTGCILLLKMIINTNCKKMSDPYAVS